MYIVNIYVYIKYNHLVEMEPALKVDTKGAYRRI
jgi:hypothetical protein